MKPGTYYSVNVADRFIKLSYNYDDGEPLRRREVDARQVRGKASFVARAFTYGLFGQPNIFVVHVDEKLALVYFCQSQFFFFNDIHVLGLARHRYEGKLFPSVFDSFETLVEQFDNKTALTRIDQPAKCLVQNDN